MSVETDAPGPFDVLSVSKVRTALRCERQAFYRYVEGIVVPPRAALVLGGAVHQGIKTGFIEKVKLDGEEPPFDVLADSFDAAFQELRYQADWRDDDPGEVKDAGYSMLKAHHEQLSPRVMPKGLDWIEHKIEFVIPGTSQQVVGFADVVTADAALIDHKTSRKSLKAVQRSREDALQLATYRLGLQLEGVNVARMAVHHLFPSKDKGKPSKGTSSPPGGAVAEEVPMLTEAQLGWWLRVMEDVGKRLRDALESGVFKAAAPGEWYCSPDWCGYWDRCMADW